MQKGDHTRGFRDRDFIQTKEGFFFCVVGPYHPADRVFAYVKYVPAKTGKWRDERTSYERVMRAYTIPDLLETFKLLKTKYQHYLFRSGIYDVTMTAVPHDFIQEHYKPEEKLAQILNTTERDSLQTKLVNFVSLISEKCGVALNNFGVTGSILLDIHNPKFSDMDVTVYGLQNSLMVRQALIKAYSDPDSKVERFRHAVLQDWCTKKVKHFPLDLEDAERIYERKWNLGIFDGVMFSVHPTHLEEELAERYGDKTFRPKGQVKLQATVADCSESLFLPCVYKVDDVKIVNGGGVDVEIQEVASYESLYDGLAEIGEQILVKGKLEQVCDCRNGTEYYRVLVGSPEGEGEEYIKPVN